MADSIQAVEASEHRIFLLKGDEHLTQADAEFLCSHGIKTIGVEVMSIGDFNTHHAFLGRNVSIIENLNLADVPNGDYFISALPIKIDGSEGAFVRAVLLEGVVTT